LNIISTSETDTATLTHSCNLQ